MGAAVRARGVLVSRRRFQAVPAHYAGMRKALSDAVRRGDKVLAKDLTARVIKAQQALFGPAGEPTDNGRPFNDDVDFIGR